jgi:hypothetical protein
MFLHLFFVPTFQAIDVFMSTCTIFVFFSLMEYALINVIMGDFVDSDQSMLKRSFRSMTKRLSTRLRRRSKSRTRKNSTVSLFCLHSRGEIFSYLLCLHSSCPTGVSRGRRWIQGRRRWWPWQQLPASPSTACAPTIRLADAEPSLSTSFLGCFSPSSSLYSILPIG